MSILALFDWFKGVGVGVGWGAGNTWMIFRYFFTRKTIFVTSCLIPHIPSSFWKEVSSKGKIFLTWGVGVCVCVCVGGGAQILSFFQTGGKTSFDNCLPSPESVSISLTLSMPHFRRQISDDICRLFFFFNKLSLEKQFIPKVERLNVKQRRSRWDGSSGSMLFAKAYYYRLWRRKS